VTLLIIGLYLAMVLAIGGLSHRLLAATGEDYFLATRSIGPFILLMSLFGTHMTAFSLLGASGEAYNRGVGVFALMASSSALVVPLVFLLVGVRLWAVGKRHGYLTQAQYFRERFASPGLGLALFVVLTALLVPYLLIGVMGGGIALNQITGGQVPEWAGSLTICLVVLTYVTTGGLRGTAWANTFQTLVFMILGAAAFLVIVRDVGGLTAAMDRVRQVAPELLSRSGQVPAVKLLSYTLIPLSVGMFPHLFMHWLTARRAASFRLSIVLYPICVLVVWVPSVLLGVVGRAEVPGLEGPAANGVLVRLIQLHAPEVLAGLLAAGVFAAVMSSLDSQTLSLGTMFTQDVVRHYGFHDRMSEAGQVRAGRLFVIAILLATFLLSLVTQRSIFRLGVWSFSGFAALFPLVVGALYWRRATRTGALAALLVTAGLWLTLFARSAPGADETLAGTGIMPVAALLAVSAVTLVVGSLLSRPPGPEVLDRFFPQRRAQ
jgi:SSS family solute:Na+ symporter